MSEKSTEPGLTLRAVAGTSLPCISSIFLRLDRWRGSGLFRVVRYFGSSGGGIPNARDPLTHTVSQPMDGIAVARTPHRPAVRDPSATTAAVLHVCHLCHVAHMELDGMLDGTFIRPAHPSSRPPIRP